MQNRSSSGVQGLVFGGLMAALVVVFSLVPLLSVFMPIPLVLAYVRYGGRVAAMTAIVATLFTVAFSGLTAAVLALPAGILPGLAFGYGFRNGWRPLTIGLLAVVVFFFGFALEYGVTRVAMFEGRDPFVTALESQAGKEQLEQGIRLVEQVMVPQVENPTPQQQATIEQGKAFVESIRKDPVGFAWALLPSSLFLLGAFSTWVNYLLCRMTLPRFGHAVPAPTPFEAFRLPVWLVWVYGLMMLGQSFFLTADVVHASWWAKLLMNIFSPLGMIFALAGGAVVYGFLRKKNYGKGVSALVVGAATMMLGVMALQIFTLLAMWDSIFDFRGLGHGIWKRPPEGTT